MNIQEAKTMLGDRAIWELKNMRKALAMFAIINTPEENKKLEAVRFLLKQKRK